MHISKCSKRPVLSPCGLKGLNYQIDPYVGCEHYCRYCYALSGAETDWTREILIHNDIIGQLDREMALIPEQTIYMGYHTDPYQPCEARYNQTRSVLEYFVEKGFSASILTKSSLVIRDIDLLKRMGNANISMSVAFNDNYTRQLFEANTMDTDERILALRQLKEIGIRTGALVCPVIPYVTNPVRLINMVAPWTDEIWVYGLSIKNRQDPSWLNIQPILERRLPDQTEKIETILFSKDHDYWCQLREELQTITKRQNLNLNIHL